VLLALFVDCTIAASETQRSEYLSEAREACVKELVYDEWDTLASQEASAPNKYQTFRSVPHSVKIPGVGEGTLEYHPGKANGPDSGWSLTADRNGQKLWSMFCPLFDVYADLPGAPKVDERRLLVGDLDSLALTLGLPVSKDSSFDILFSEIERKLTQQKVTIPGVEVAFDLTIAPWIVSMLVLALITMIRNGVRRVVTDDEFAAEEPWIALDGQEGLEKLLACIWIGAILIAPWVAGGCLLMMVSEGFFVKGDIGSVLGFIWIYCAALLLEVTGGWASLTATSDILRLRSLRNKSAVD
jgi:hypothetical protein